jgi:hypothetical protein
MQLKQRMGFKKGTEFEVAFWSLKQKSADDAAFRALVDETTPEQVVEMGKQYFIERQQANDPQYTQHATWDAMIDAVIKKIKTPPSKHIQNRSTPAQNKANKIQGF